MRFVFAGLIALAGSVVCLNAPRAAVNAEPKHTIKEVMKKAHKDGLLKKVASGKAEVSERKELVELYVALSESEPPRGAAADWQKRTGDMVKAAKAAVDDPAAGKALGRTVNCAGCHKLHK